MKKQVLPGGHRLTLYGSGLAVSALLILAGVVYQPEPKMDVSDLEAALAIHMSVSNFEGARTDIRLLLEAEPEHLYAILMDAYIYYDEGNVVEALSRYRKALPLAKAHPIIAGYIWDNIAVLSMKSGSYEDAQAEAERKITVFGENVLSRLIIALSSFSRNDDKSYEEHLNKAMEMGNLDPAFNIRLDTLVEDYDTLQQLYVQNLLDRARYEHQQTGLLGI